MQLFVVLLLGVSLMLSNPIRDHKHDVYNQTLVPSHVYVTRMLDPMKALLRAGDVPTLLQLRPAAGQCGGIDADAVVV